MSVTLAIQGRPEWASSLRYGDCVVCRDASDGHEYEVMYAASDDAALCHKSGRVPWGLVLRRKEFGFVKPDVATGKLPPETGLTLDMEERRRLTECENTIERGRTVFAAVSTAIIHIRAGRLYRETHESFEAYARDRWGFGKAYAYQLATSAEVNENLRAPERPAPLVALSLGRREKRGKRMSESAELLDLAEAERLATALREQLAPACHRIEIAGSIRRKKPSGINDIELVSIPRLQITRDPMDLFGEREETVSLLWGACAEFADLTPVKGGDRFRQFRLRISGVRTVGVDVFTTTEDNWGLIMAIRTGGWEFSRALVIHARQAGYPSAGGYLHAGTDDGPMVTVPDEETLFGLLGLEWVAPEARTGPEALRKRKARA